MDIQVLTALALPISIMFFILGALIGWVARDYMMNYREIPSCLLYTSDAADD